MLANRPGDRSEFGRRRTSLYARWLLGVLVAMLAPATVGVTATPALAGATEYLALAGDVIGGMLLASGLRRALALPAMAKSLLVEQEALLGFYAETVLARAAGRLPAIRIGAAALG